MTAATVVAVVMLIGAPVAVMPGALNRFVFGKLAVAAVGAGAAALCTPAGRLRREVRVVLGLGAIVLLAAALASDQPVAGLLGRAPRYEGIFVLATYVAAAWAGARLLGPVRRPDAVLLTVRVLTVVALLVGFFAVLEAAGLRPLTTDVSRPGSLLGNASDAGAIGVLCLGPLALFAVRCRDRIVAAGAVAAAVVTVLSASRGALAAMVVELVILGIVLGGRRAVAGGLAAIVAVAGLALVVPATRHRVLGTSPLASHTVTGRGLLWRETLSLDAAHLGLGVGPSNFKSEIVGQHTREWQAKVGPQDPPDSPHSFPLQALTAGGIPLLLLALVLAALVLVIGGREGWRTRHGEAPFIAGAVISLIGYGVTGMVGLTSPGPMLLAAVLTGAVLAAAPAPPMSRSVQFARASAGGLFLLGALFVLAAIAEIPLRHAIIDVSRGDDGAAQQAFSAARDLRPWDVDLPDVAAHAFVTHGLDAADSTAIDYAAIWLRKVPGELRGDEQVELDAASLDEARGAYPSAVRLLTGVLVDDRDNPAVLLQRGVVEAESGHADDAERDFRSAASVVPDDPGPWQDLAVLYRQEGRTADATAAATHAHHLAR